MSDIDDDGKIWLRGSVRPEYGVRVGELYFIIGKEDADDINCYIQDNCLLADLHNPEKQYRIIRRFILDQDPQSHGTLFNGFTNTKHGDIRAVTCRDDGVAEFLLNGEDYLNNKADEMDSCQFMQLAGWK